LGREIEGKDEEEEEEEGARKEAGCRRGLMRLDAPAWMAAG